MSDQLLKSTLPVPPPLHAGSGGGGIVIPRHIHLSEKPLTSLEQSAPTPTLATPDKSGVSRRMSYSCEEYLNLPRETQTWLVRPLIPVGGRCNLYGDAKVGKSFAAIQLAAAISGGLPDWLGFNVPANGPVLYVQLDTPRSLWLDRLDEITSSGFDLSRVHFADRESLDAWPFNIGRDDHFYRLRSEVMAVSPVAVIIDTLKESHSVEENSSSEIQPIIARLTAAVHPAALILISHSRKANYETGPDLINDGRGSNYIPGAMDAIIRFTKKHMMYTGRACEEGSIKLRRLDCGLWEPEGDEVDVHVKAVLADASLTSIRARARSLSEKTGKTEESCRAILRRREPVKGGTRDLTQRPTTTEEVQKG